VQGWRLIKALNLQANEARTFAFFINQFAVFNAQWINYWTARVLVIPKIKDEFLMQFSLYFLGGLLIIGGSFEIGALLVFMQYYGILSGAIKTVSDTDAALLSNMPQSDRVIEELTRKQQYAGNKMPSESNCITFKNVSFAYPHQENIIENISFEIADGERVAITGKSGAGKTTILKLMTKMLRPTSGRVLFGGMEIGELAEAELYRRVGFVMQENTLFNTTLRENLSYGKNNATDAEIEIACKKACVDFIHNLPDGLDAIIGERGIKLSGGQKQRVVLARLFLRDTDVFIFDEATSALDRHSEGIIHDAIKSIGDDKTVIIVSHRQSAMEICDRCVVVA